MSGDPLTTLWFGNFFWTATMLKLHTWKRQLFGLFTTRLQLNPSFLQGSDKQAWAERPQLQTFVVLTALCNSPWTWKFIHICLNPLLFKAS